jgi:hypothetical protein
MAGGFVEERLLRFTVVMFEQEGDALLAYMAHR